MTAHRPQPTSGGRSELERAVELAYRVVSPRDRTVAEVRAHLARKGIGGQAIERAVEELETAGFLDDARFAQRFAEDKRALERWGRDRIERELCRRGIDPELVEAAIAPLDPDDELEVALSVLDRRMAPPVTDPERDRAWRLLVRKGYSPELAYEAVRIYGRHEPPEEPSLAA